MSPGHNHCRSPTTGLQYPNPTYFVSQKKIFSSLTTFGPFLHIKLLFWTTKILGISGPKSSVRQNYQKPLRPYSLNRVDSEAQQPVGQFRHPASPLYNWPTTVNLSFWNQFHPWATKLSEVSPRVYHKPKFITNQKGKMISPGPFRNMERR